MNKMQFRLTIVLLALCAFASGSHLKSAKINLSKLVLQSRATIEDNPTRSILCFGDYLDEINEVTNVYEGELEKCTSDSKDALTALDKTFAGDRADLAASAASVCQLFSDCNANARAVDFFTCYSKAGNDASRTTFSIGSQADQFTKEVAQMESQITYTKSQCDTASKAKYEKSADSCYTSLQNCINEPASAPEVIAVHSKVMQQALSRD